MKKEFNVKPENLIELWDGEIASFSWEDFITAIPSPLFLVSTYKSNGKENACLQSWATFTGRDETFICLIAASNKNGHMYKSLKETGCCVLNFPSRDVYDQCTKTIDNNGFDDDEITKSGLTAEKAMTVNAPRIKECFLNIECIFLWEHELFKNSRHMTVALKATHICMENNRYNENIFGRYGKTGYMYNINNPKNPDTGENYPECFGALELYK